MADWFCSDFHAVDNGTLAAACSRDPQRAKSFAEAHGIARAHAGLDALLADPDVDIVYIATPHTAHYDAVRAALSAGKHVLCEKPLVTRVTHACALVEHAEANGRYLAEALWTWHLPAMRKAVGWMNDGRIGRILQVDTSFGYPVPFSAGQREWNDGDAGGVLREMGIYPVAINRLFVEGPPRDIQVTHRKAPNGVESHIAAIFDQGQAISSLSTSMLARLGNGATITGELGRIEIPDAFRADECSLYELDERVAHFEAPRDTRGYHYQAVDAGRDIAAGRLQSSIVPLSASLAFQQDMAAILARIRQE